MPTPRRRRGAAAGCLTALNSSNLRPHWFKGQRFCVSFLYYIYHVSPHETQNPDEFVTEICLPVVKA